MAHISVVSPVYNAEAILPGLVERITTSVKKITENFEIILVEDGGADNSWEVIEDIAKTNPHVFGIKLSRNFGQHYAITAGLDYCTGDWVVVMDCDLQDLPEEIPRLYAAALKGYDVVFAKRKQRKDSFLKKAYSKLFYQLLTYLTGTKYDASVANFGIYKRQVVDVVKSMRESIRVFPIMVKWAGFKITVIDVNHGKRELGASNYNFKKAAKLALSIILAFSDKPILLVIKTGLLISAFAFLFAIIVLFRWFYGLIGVTGYTSLIISIWFLSGIILSTLGIIGLYVGKTFEGVKNRPLYIIEKQTK